MRTTINEVQRHLGVEREALYYTCNRLGIAVSPSGAFDYPESGPLCKLWHRTLASRPRNAAQRLIHDLKRGIV